MTAPRSFFPRWIGDACRPASVGDVKWIIQIIVLLAVFGMAIGLCAHSFHWNPQDECMKSERFDYVADACVDR